MGVNAIFPNPEGDAGRGRLRGHRVLLVRERSDQKLGRRDLVVSLERGEMQPHEFAGIP